MPRCPIYQSSLFRFAAICTSALILAIGSLSSSASESRETPVVLAVKRARTSIVNIHGHKSVTRENGRGFGEGPRRVNGMGTGVIIDERGYIVTNHHVVDGVRRIQVTMFDGQVVVAKMIARDPKTDLAIIKIPSGGSLPLIDTGTSSDLMTGETVIAVGNAYGYEHTVTVGIVSALNRTVQVSDTQSYANLIQTDASINPGNSGGPLLNIDGEMIGLNVAVRVGAQGIGFALPIDAVMEIASRMISVKKLENRWHGVVGRTIVSAEGSHYIIRSVDSGSPASREGLKAGDVISRVNGSTVQRALDFERAMLGQQESLIEITFEREGKALTTKLHLASLPDRDPTVNDRAWHRLGIRLETVPSAKIRKINSKYRGGMEVQAVRPSGPAAIQGIRRGDILVGMHIWETISLDNIAYILNRNDLDDLQPVKFYVLRGEQTLYGHLQVSMTR